MSRPLPAAVLIDMDGTLVLTEEMWLEAETRTMTSLGSDWTQDDQRHCLGGPMSRVMAYMVQRAGGGHDQAEVQEMVLSAMQEQLRTEPVHWAPGAEELLDSLEAAGVPSALVSASPRRLVDVVLERIGSTHFATTVAGDEVARTKPDPDPYLEAARRLDVDIEDCVVIEDSPVGVASGLAAGAVTVAVPHLAPIPASAGLHVVESLTAVSLERLSGWAARG